jgi:tetratricopeptide (TPR) repeat protein
MPPSRGGVERTSEMFHRQWQCRQATRAFRRRLSTGAGFPPVSCFRYETPSFAFTPKSFHNGRTNGSRAIRTMHPDRLGGLLSRRLPTLMADFLLTATDRLGKRETVRVQADDSQAAWRQLESQGCRDITLHTSDVEAVSGLTGLDNGNVTPADYIQIRGLSRVGFFLFLVKRLYSRALWGFALLIVLIVVNGLTSAALGIVGALSLVLLGLPLLLALWATLFGKSFRYNKLQEALAWGRWEEVLRLVPPFRAGRTAFDAAAREACALAGLGRVDEGLQKLEAQRSASETPEWMYLARVAEVYGIAQMHEDGLACYRLAYQDAPNNAAVQLGLANALLRSERDLPLAKELIAAVESQHPSDLLAMVLPHAQGLFALNSGNPAEAKRCFLLAHEKLSAFAAASPALGPMIDTNRACLAVALAELGDRRTAEDHYRLARPRLVALNSVRLLDRVERALTTR